MAPWQYSKIHMWKADGEKCQLNADIDGYSLPGRGTVSPDLCVTPERPDIVIHDRLTNKLFIFEMTVPLVTNILNVHTRKNRYSHFIPDITSANVKVIPFEIGSRGYISPDNKTSLKLLFKYCWVGRTTEPFSGNKQYNSVNVPILQSTKCIPYPDEGRVAQRILKIRNHSINL